MRDNFELEQEGYLASESFPEDSHDALLHAMSDSEIGFHDDHIEGMQRKCPRRQNKKSVIVDTRINRC